MILRKIKSRIVLVAVIATTFVGLASFKVFYIGVRQTPVGKVGDHDIVFCWTWTSLGSLISDDGREGYYRIYSPDGQKVFEIFTDTYEHDIILPGDNEVEFQLDVSDSIFWPPRK